MTWLIRTGQLFAGVLIIDTISGRYRTDSYCPQFIRPADSSSVPYFTINKKIPTSLGWDFFYALQRICVGATDVFRP